MEAIWSIDDSEKAVLTSGCQRNLECERVEEGAHRPDTVIVSPARDKCTTKVEPESPKRPCMLWPQLDAPRALPTQRIIVTDPRHACDGDEMDLVHSLTRELL